MLLASGTILISEHSEDWSSVREFWQNDVGNDDLWFTIAVDTKFLSL